MTSVLVTKMTGQQFKDWADQTNIDRKQMAAQLGIGLTKLYSMFRCANLTTMEAMAIKEYKRCVIAGLIK